MHNSKTGNVYTNCFSKLIYITFMWNVYQLVYWTHKTYGNYRAQRKSINSKPKLKYKLRRSSVFYRLDRKMFHKTIIKFTFFDFRLQIKKKNKIVFTYSRRPTHSYHNFFSLMFMLISGMTLLYIFIFCCRSLFVVYCILYSIFCAVVASLTEKVRIFIK